MGVVFRRAVLPLSNLLPEPLLRLVLRGCLGTTSLALCFHRVSDTPRGGGRLTMRSAEMDRFIELALRTRPLSPPWLTVSFDDGYADAAAYVASRAPRYPSVEWLYFVCPEKAEKETGFRWDLDRRPDAAEPIDIETENERTDLRALAQRPELRLADVATCKRLQRVGNVALGNHTNCHYRQTLFPVDDAAAEYERSLRDFNRLFGFQGHFAFPFGTPELEFNASHVALLRRMGGFLIWSSEARPYRSTERVAGAVLPRFTVDGSWSHREIAFWIAARALHFRLFGTRFRYPVAN